MGPGLVQLPRLRGSARQRIADARSHIADSDHEALGPYEDLLVHNEIALALVEVVMPLRSVHPARCGGPWPTLCGLVGLELHDSAHGSTVQRIRSHRTTGD